MKTVTEMAKEAGFACESDGEIYIDHRDGVCTKNLNSFAELVRADEAEKYKWDVHSCGPTCKRYACVAMREAVEAEREQCLHAAEVAASLLNDPIAAIRARSNT